MRTVTESRFSGNAWILILWVVLCIPVALVYYLAKREYVTVRKR